MSFTISYYLKQIDFLGNPISFTINNQGIFKTILGGLLSMILYISYVYFFINFGMDFIFKLNPSVYYETKIQKPNPNYSFY